MSIESPKFEKKEKKQIIDIETQKAVLEEWEKRGLKSEVEDLLFGFEDLVPPGERFPIHTASFESADKFIQDAEHCFKKLGGKNLEAKTKEVENNVRKSILSFTVEELGINPKNPEIAKTKEVTEEIDGKEKKLIIKYFKTNQENFFLATDNIDWWLEKEGEEK